MREVAILLLVAEVASLICALASGLLVLSRGVTARETEGEEVVFRQRVPAAIFGMSLFLFLALSPLFLLGGGEPAGAVAMAFLSFGGVSLVPLLMGAPEELCINPRQRTYRWRKGWIWRHPRAGSLDDMAGVCTTRKSILLVPKKTKKTWFNGSVLRVASLGDPGAGTAEDLIEMLGLPLIAIPWQPSSGQRRG